MKKINILCRRGSTPRLQAVTLDLLSQNNEDTDALVEVLRSSIAGGELPLFSSIIDNDWWKEVGMVGRAARLTLIKWAACNFPSSSTTDRITRKCFVWSFMIIYDYFRTERDFMFWF